MTNLPGTLRSYSKLLRENKTKLYEEFHSSAYVWKPFLPQVLQFFFLTRYPLPFITPKKIKQKGSPESHPPFAVSGSSSPSKRTSVSSFQSAVDSDSAASINLNMEQDNVNFHIKKPAKYPHVPPPANEKSCVSSHSSQLSLSPLPPCQCSTLYLSGLHSSSLVYATASLFETIVWLAKLHLQHFIFPWKGEAINFEHF